MDGWILEDSKAEKYKMVQLDASSGDATKCVEGD